MNIPVLIAITEQDDKSTATHSKFWGYAIQVYLVLFLAAIVLVPLAFLVGGILTHFGILAP